jgi:flagellin
MASFSVVNNLPGISAQQQAGINQLGLQRTLYRLSSGLRINSGRDDAAGLAIADGLRAQIRSLQQSVRNANDGIGYLQIADSALGEVTNLLNRAAQLLSEAASDTNAGGEAAIEAELAQIYQEIDRVGSATTFNGATIFAAGTLNVFVGDTTNVSAATAQIQITTSALSTSELAISAGVTGTGSSIAVAIDNTGGTASAGLMLTEIATAIDTVAAKRGDLGAKMNRMDNAVNIMGAQLQNLTAAESQIRDANMAEEVANLTRYQILSQVGLAAMAQANAVPQGVLALLQ